MGFGESMRICREARGVSLYRLAALTGITAQQLANYESGRSEATVGRAARICEALDMTYTLGKEAARDND